MTILTLMTDFGLKDGNVGVMKGVIWGIAPQAQLVDLSHLIGPQDVPEAALILSRSAPYFPAGTVHLVVVDPGVGTRRWPMAARLGDQYFVGPDNGIITLLLERLDRRRERGEFYHLDRPQYWLPQVSHVFHGRDIFAPAAAHLAKGIPLEELGSRFAEPVRLSLPKPERTATGWKGVIIHADHFGNLATNLLREHLGEPEKIRLRLAGMEINGLVNTFGERPEGELIALYGSTGNLIVSVVNGSAAQRTGARVGTPVEILVP